MTDKISLFIVLCISRVRTLIFFGFVVDAEIAILAEALCIKKPVAMLAFKSFLLPALRVVAILAHAICIVFLINVIALCNVLPVRHLLASMLHLLLFSFLE